MESNLSVEKVMHDYYDLGFLMSHWGLSKLHENYLSNTGTFSNNRSLGHKSHMASQFARQPGSFKEPFLLWASSKLAAFQITQEVDWDRMAKNDLHCLQNP